MKKLFLILVMGLLSLFSCYSQNDNSEEDNKYEDICYCQIELASPQDMIEIGNNREVLLALKKWKTLTELNADGLSCSEKQLQVLEAMNMVEKKGSQYRTLIPFFSDDETMQLRKDTKNIAGKLIPIIEADYDSIRNTLNSRKFQGNTYTLFFAYVLDNLVWKILEKDGLVDKKITTVEKPFWSGLYWIMTPKREFSCGTNVLRIDNYTINENWSDQSEIGVTNYSLLKLLLNDYKSHGKITDSRVKEGFEKNGLFDLDGELKIPVVHADSSDIFYRQATVIGEKIASYLKNNVQYNNILTDWPFLKQGQKIIILYHEIMWDLLDEMEAHGMIKKPVAFADPKATNPQYLKDLLFIVVEPTSVEHK